MINIEIISSESGGVIQSTNNSVVRLNQSSIVKINLNVDEFASITRQGNAAVITLKNGETITLENYFDYPIETSQILFENEGELIWAQFTDATGAVLDSVNYIPLSNIAPLAGETVAGAAISPWLIGAGLAAGLGVAIAAVQDDSGSKNTKDTTAPDAAIINLINETDPITGKAEPGAKVEVTFPDGSKTEVEVGVDGNWSVDNPGLEDGDEVKVIVTDPAGNVSKEAVAVVDGKAPNLPVIDPVNATDPITGTAEPGSKVSVTFPDGTTAETTAGPDGKWSVANPGLKDGDEVKVIATDAAGNASAESTSRVDGQAPNLPVIDPVNATDPITGTAEPGSKVSVTFPDTTTV